MFKRAGACFSPNPFAPERSPSLVTSRRAVKAGNPMRKCLSSYWLPSWRPSVRAARCAASDPGQLVKSVTVQALEIASTTSGAPATPLSRGSAQQFRYAAHGSSRVGAYWNQASEQQRARFLAALETQEARAYGERLGSLPDIL